MARLKPGSILENVTGRVGEIVIVNLNGTKIVRSRPRRNKEKEASPLQKMHLASFAAQHAIAKSVRTEIIDRIWTHVSFKGGMNPYNGFIKANSPAFAKMDYVVFPEQMKISEGGLLPVRGFRVKKEGDNLVFTWEKGQTRKNASPKDLLNLAVLFSQRSLKVIEVDAKRGDGRAVILNPEKEAEFIEGYAFWSSEDDQRFSSSCYWCAGQF